jgi:hypothetical protein
MPIAAVAAADLLMKSRLFEAMYQNVKVNFIQKKDHLTNIGKEGETGISLDSSIHLILQYSTQLNL